MEIGSLFDVGHVAQLHEIQRARLKRGQPGVGDFVQELIRRLTSGGVAGTQADPRISQVKRLWDLGVGRVLGIGSFEEYLAGIPVVPPEVEAYDDAFPYLVLVEPRVGFSEFCGMAAIYARWHQDVVAPFEERYTEFSGPTWIRIQDGRKNHDRSWRNAESAGELFLTAIQGVCAYIHHPGVLEATEGVPERGGHVMDLLGTIMLGQETSMASLHKQYNGVVEFLLGARGYGSSHGVKHGGATRKLFLAA